MSLVHLNIGSNQGNRTYNIERAVALIALRAGTVTARSCLYASEPWGYDSQSQFLNCGINIETALPPLELLGVLQNIEREIAPKSPHRNLDGSYRDRVIDIDIILYEGVTMDTPQLTLPHPHACERQFVLDPLLEIYPRGEKLL